MKNVIRRQTLGDVLRRTALRVPSRTAIICGSTQLTYAEFDALVSRLSAGLAQLGVVQGDCVAVLARNSHAIRGHALCAGPARRRAGADQFHAQGRRSGLHPAPRRRSMLATDSGLAELARAAAALQTEVAIRLAAGRGASEPVAGNARLRRPGSQPGALPVVDTGRNRLAADRLHQRHRVQPQGRDAHPRRRALAVRELRRRREIAPGDVMLHALPLYHCAQLDVFLGPADLCRGDQHHHRQAHAGQPAAADRTTHRSALSSRRRRSGFHCCARRCSITTDSPRCARAITARRSCRWKC